MNTASTLFQRHARRAAGLLITAVVMLLVPAVPQVRASLQPGEAERILAEAEDHFRQGAGLLESDREESRRRLEQAIAGFDRLIRDGGVRNGGLYYNIGNAYLLMGDSGRAILNYRRAERLTPRDPNLLANLSHARQRVPSRIDAPAPERIRRALLFWHDETPSGTRWTAFLIAYSVGWGLAFLRLTGLIRWGGWWPGALCLVLAASAMASLIIEHRSRLKGGDAVIVAQQVVGRKGPDARAYEPSFTESLHGGVEVRVVEQRPGWSLVRLADGRETWLESAAVEMVGG